MHAIFVLRAEHIILENNNMDYNENGVPRHQPPLVGRDPETWSCNSYVTKHPYKEGTYASKWMASYMADHDRAMLWETAASLP